MNDCDHILMLVKTYCGYKPVFSSNSKLSENEISEFTSDTYVFRFCPKCGVRLNLSLCDGSIYEYKINDKTFKSLSAYIRNTPSL